MQRQEIGKGDGDGGKWAADSNGMGAARELEAAVLKALGRSGYADLRHIGCEISDDRVILRGAVPSYHLKQLAQVVARRVCGVERIDNRLAVSL